MSQPWGRLYTGTRNHRKIAAVRRKHKDTWTYLYVLMECSFETDDDGKIYIDPDLPYSIEELADEIHFHKKPIFLKNLIQTAVQVGLLAYENQIPQWLSYSERQFKTDHNGAARVRKYREKRKTENEKEDKCNVTETLACNDNVTDQIQIQIQKQNRTETTPLPPPRGNGNGVEKDFEIFWAIYPRKTGKQAALQKFKSLRRTGRCPPIPVLLAAVNQQKTWDQWQKDGGQYIPNPATWLNQGRWEDKPPEASRQMADF